MKQLATIALLAASVNTLRAANNLNNHGGPTMQNQVKAFFIYWMPSGVVLDTSVTNGVGNFESLTKHFFDDLSATSFYNIVTQYPGQCGSNQCVVQNGPVAAKFGGSWVDTQAYPHAGTRADPLQDSDIQNEVKRAVSQNHWTVDANSEFFVVTGVFKNTGKGVEECDSSSSNCTFNAFCAYHGNFGFNGTQALYSYLSDASFNSAGCGEGISTATNTQLASDREVALMTHEFIETVTDPQGNGWWDSTTGSEIGDNCNQIAAVVTMNGNRYAVQQEWSNDTASCVSAFGPSIQFTIGTGGDDLRGDSSATASLQRPAGATFETVNLKKQSESGWGNNSGHIAVAGFNQPSQTALGQVLVRLTSHNSGVETNDNWNIQNLTAKVFTATGTMLCQQTVAGNPLARLTGSAPTALFATPNCQPPVPPAATFSQITFNIGTGGDDLRGDSSATVSVALPGGAKTFTLKAQGESSWDNNSAHTKTFTISPAVTLAAFGNISFTLTSHNSFTESDDNWNIQSVGVTAAGSSGSACVLNQSGNPVSRLTGSAGTVTLHPRTGC
jgi:hypothetical protein